MSDDTPEDYDKSVIIPVPKFCPECGTPLSTFTIEGQIKVWCDECNGEWVLDDAQTLVARPRKARQR